MDDYEKYEEDCQTIRKSNQQLLKEFEGWLKSSGLSEKTINNHFEGLLKNGTTGLASVT